MKAFCQWPFERCNHSPNKSFGIVIRSVNCESVNYTQITSTMRTRSSQPNAPFYFFMFTQLFRPQADFPINFFFCIQLNVKLRHCCIFCSLDSFCNELTSPTDLPHFASTFIAIFIFKSRFFTRNKARGTEIRDPLINRAFGIQHFTN